MAGFLRITGGKLVRRRFQVPRAADQGLTRPTGDKVREAIFSSLSTLVKDAHVLDLFAGSGAYGFEAISRGARSILFVEKTPTTAKCIEENAKILDVFEQCRFKIANALTFVMQNNHEFYELIFVDPPYGFSLEKNFWASLQNFMIKETTVIFRCKDKKDFVCPLGYQITREKAYGGTAVFFLSLS